MHIRLLAPSDAKMFQLIRLQALRECPPAFAASFEEECDLSLSVVSARLAPTEHCGVFGAFEGNELIGITGVVREAKRKLSHKSFVWGVYVAPAFRNAGVGRKLVAEALRYAAAMDGVLQVNLGVNAANNAAIALYESLGFCRFGLERRFMLIDGIPQDELHMVSYLNGPVS